MRALVDTHRERGRGRDRPLVRAAGRARVRAHRPRRRRPARPHRRGRRRDRRGARAPRGQLRRSTSSAPRSSGPCSSGSSRTTRRASSTSPTRSACSSATARPSPCTSPPDRVRGGGHQHARRARRRRRRAARPDQRGAHARRRDDRRSRRRRGSTPTSRSSPTSTIHPFSVLRGADPDRDRRQRSARSPTSGRARCSASGSKVGHVRRDQELDGRRPDEGPAPLLHRRRRDRRGLRTSPPGTSPPTSATSPGQPKSDDPDREQRQDRCPQYVRCSCRDW